MKLFLSVPFSSKVLPDGSLEPAYVAAMQACIAGLRKNGHEVFCSLEHAGWSFGGMTSPADEFRQDIAEIDRADKLVILLEERISAGCQIEIGYAFAKQKQLEVYQIGAPAWSNTAFFAFAQVPLTSVGGMDDFMLAVLAGNR